MSHSAVVPKQQPFELSEVNIHPWLHVWFTVYYCEL